MRGKRVLSTGVRSYITIYNILRQQNDKTAG